MVERATADQSARSSARTHAISTQRASQSRPARIAKVGWHSRAVKMLPQQVVSSVLPCTATITVPDFPKARATRTRTAHRSTVAHADRARSSNATTRRTRPRAVRRRRADVRRVVPTQPTHRTARTGATAIRFTPTAATLAIAPARFSISAAMGLWPTARHKVAAVSCRSVAIHRWCCRMRTAAKRAASIRASAKNRVRGN